jgi:large subunit ribosomal protein L22
MAKTVQANQKYIRQSPRKLMLVADMVRGQKVDQALNQLAVSTKRAAQVMYKVLTQAQKNAINNSGLTNDSLIIDSLRVSEGPTYKRWRPVSRGRAHPIKKRTSHLSITLKGKTPEETIKKPAAATKKKAKKE